MEDNIKYVTCKICGAKRRVLTQHIAKHHSMSRKEYEEAYNSPAVCYERQLIQIERNKELNHLLSTDPYYIKLMEKVRRENGTLPHVIKSLNLGREKYQSSEEGKKRNSEIMKRNIECCDMQGKATQGKINSEKFHKQKSEFMTNLLKEKWKDEEWKKKHLAKMFDGSKKEYEDVNGEIVYLRSSWELELHNYLISNKIDFGYEQLRIEYISTDGKLHEYFPDFYVKSLNMILEVKPNMFTSNKINQIKRKVAIEAGYKFRFVTEKELSDLNSFFHNM